ncbi:hypothetical protein Nepgr_033407 [Nepenthes gracilis]|uniref:Uncharacterized protein n=1 Tax=Nepenthes gracilis TaxID=150966 RepID=A0AAD3TKK2_NEPGR|nr:hypothetical protein Nepgr_033407 [Nepenthes gracilis]
MSSYVLHSTIGCNGSETRNSSLTFAPVDVRWSIVGGAFLEVILVGIGCPCCRNTLWVESCKDLASFVEG